MSAEEKRLRAITKSAAFLQSCFPPNRQAGAARILAKLGGPQPDTALLETLLEGTSYTRLSPVDCPNPSCLRSFLFSECNRDGDAYRCVWCNKLVHGDGSFTPPEAPSALPKALRALERSFNLAFIDYATAYFGSSALVNCYLSPRNEYDKGLITVTILIRKMVEGNETTVASTTVAGDDAGLLNGSIWNSSHSIHLRIDRDYKIDVASTSTVYIESQSPPCRFSGHVTKPNAKFAIAIPEALHEDFEANRSDITAFCARSASTRQLLVTSIGDLVQRAENRLRDVIGSIYFGKSAQVGTDLRCPIGRTEQNQTRMMSAVTGNDGSRSGAAMNFPSVDATGNAYEVLRAKASSQQQQQLQLQSVSYVAAPAPLPPPTHKDPVTVTSTPSSYWQQAEDEEGNVYYTNTETGETEWELPEGGVVVEQEEEQEKEEDYHSASKKEGSKKEKKDKKDKKDKKSAKREYEEVAENEEEEQQQQQNDVDGDEEWTISSVLYSLELGGDIEEYLGLFAACEINTVEELLQCDKDYLKDSVGISSSSDRKKISKWINETYEQQQQQEE